MSKRRYFGTDGVRGTVGQGNITAEFALKLAHAVGRVLRRTELKPTVVIGKDTRVSGYMLETALVSGFTSAGVDVITLGPLPTPGVAYLTRALRADLGVVISASHNPFDDNGIKFFSSRGTKLDDDWELAVEAAMDEPAAWVPSRQLGRSKRLEDAAGRYIEFAKSTFDTDLSLKGLRIVVDGAHGAAYHIAPNVFHELGADVVAIGCEPNGLNINDEVGATHPEALVAKVNEVRADYGIALDGDADRLQMVDAQGRLFNGDEVLYLMVVERLDRGEKVPGAVGTVMSNMAIENALKARGVEFVRAKVGDRYVLEELAKRGWLLGGESSGHLLAMDKHTTGDGIVSALQVLQACARSGKSLAQMLEGVEMYPQALINVRLRPGQDWAATPGLDAVKAAVEAELGTRGRLLLRPSGTEPVVRVMVEADDAGLAHRCAHQVAAVLRG